MDCIFCKIVSGQIPTKIIKETSCSISFMDAFPLAKGHALVIPKKHHKKLQANLARYLVTNGLSS